MLYQSKYEIDSAHILPGPPESIKWVATGSGEYAIGRIGSAEYFIKRFSMGLRYPISSIPEPVYSQMLADAQWLEGKQNDIRNRCKTLDVDTDHVVTEDENFWDENVFVTVTRKIPGENIGADYRALDANTFLTLCRELTLLIQKIHDVGITHGDLKVKNVLIKSDGGTLVPYLIDFDSSYPSDYATTTRADGRPMLSYPVVYSPGYESPEIAWYNCNDEGVVPASTITNKTDIFTLAIIFHQLWTNEFPTIVGAGCGSVGEAVYMDMPLKFDPKFDVPMGTTNNSLFSALLRWMMQKDSTVRPTARQVLDALNDVIEVDDEFSADGGAAKFDLEPHDAHKATVDILDKDALKALGVKAFAKVVCGGEYKYFVKLKDGSEATLSVDEIIDKGYGKAKASSVCDLWPEDAEKYEMVAVDEIAKLGLAAIERREAGYKHFYYILSRAGVFSTCGIAGLLGRGIVKEKLVKGIDVKVDADTPWPEHGTAYNTEALAARGICKVECVVEGGENRYLITFSDKQRVVKIGYMKLMNFIV